MLLGQYSTGKTTFIKYLLETDYPGLRIGPEPTTDKFVAIMHGEQDQVSVICVIWFVCVSVKCVIYQPVYMWDVCVYDNKVWLTLICCDLFISYQAKRSNLYTVFNPKKH